MQPLCSLSPRSSILRISYWPRIPIRFTAKSRSDLHTSRFFQALATITPGLFTVLPPSVVAGQVSTITVRRITTRRAAITAAPPTRGLDGGIADASALAASVFDASFAGKKMVNWRYVTGSFAVRIPATTAKVMLPLEEDNLAIMKWRLTQMLPTNRWYPVLCILKTLSA
jgi:hypothetical protein